MNQIRYLVGYRPHERGQDALSLAVVLAESFDAALDVVFVVREHSAYAPAYPPVGREEPIVAQHARNWLAEAAASVPEGIEVATHVRYAPSVAEGLMGTADELDSALIVIGSGSAGIVRRHQLGAVASTLLHRATRPVTLVPSSYRATGPIERIDCAVGLRPGGQSLLNEAVEAAARRDLPLRLITMVDIDRDDLPDDDPAPDPDPEQFVRGHVDELLARAVAQHGAPTSTDLVIARGGIQEAVESVPWDDASILLVGSSRLAEPRRFFLGSTAYSLLRTLSVPVVAIPTGARFDGAETDGTTETDSDTAKGGAGA